MNEVIGLTELAEQAARCHACALAPTRTTVVFGSGDPHPAVVFVGEAPGREEDLGGAPFLGRSGQLLRTLAAATPGLADAPTYIMNTVKCRPPGNRAPKAAELSACRPFFDAQLALLAPTVVVPLGNVATKAVLGTGAGITKVRGQSYELSLRGGQAQSGGDAGVRTTTVVPTFHPAAALRNGARVVAAMEDDLARAALVLEGGAEGTQARGTEQ